MPRPLSNADHHKFVQTEGWEQKGTAKSARKTGDHSRYTLRLNNGEVLSIRVSHGGGSLNDPMLVAGVLRDQLQVSEADFYRCVDNGVLPPRPAPAASAPPPGGLDGTLVRNLMMKVGMTQHQVASLTMEGAVAAWQKYVAEGER